eukprot:399810-Rhodomonas_salina.1
MLHGPQATGNAGSPVSASRESLYVNRNGVFSHQAPGQMGLGAVCHAHSGEPLHPLVQLQHTRQHACMRWNKHGAQQLAQYRIIREQFNCSHANQRSSQLTPSVS